MLPSSRRGTVVEGAEFELHDINAQPFCFLTQRRYVILQRARNDRFWCMKWWGERRRDGRCKEKKRGFLGSDQREEGLKRGERGENVGI